MIDLADLRNALDRHRGRVVVALTALCGAGVVVAGVVWWMSRGTPPPSIFDSPVDNVMAYLAMDDFSKLPLEERIRFLRDFADRFRGLDQGESAVLAGFLAGLSGPARETLRQNVRLMAKDILADGANRYFAIESDVERKRFLDEWLVEWMRTGERIAEGTEQNRSDADRLAEVKADGRQEAERRPRRPVTFDAVDATRFLDFWQQDVEAASTPKEQGQIVRFLTDLRDHIVRG